MGLLSRGEIERADDLATIDVPCPEWGGDVRLRALDGVQRAAWMTAVSVEDRDARLNNIYARLVSMSAIGADGKPLFPGPEGEKASWAALRGSP